MASRSPRGAEQRGGKEGDQGQLSLRAVQLSKSHGGQQREGQDGGYGEACLLGSEIPKDVHAAEHGTGPENKWESLFAPKGSASQSRQGDEDDQLPAEVAVVDFIVERQQKWPEDKRGWAMDAECRTEGVVVATHLEPGGVDREPLTVVGVKRVASEQPRAEIERQADEQGDDQGHRQ